MLCSIAYHYFIESEPANTYYFEDDDEEYFDESEESQFNYSEFEESDEEWLGRIRAIHSGKADTLLRTSDWGESADDFEPDDWEDYFSGPDDE